MSNRHPMLAPFLVIALVLVVLMASCEIRCPEPDIDDVRDCLHWRWS